MTNVLQALHNISNCVWGGGECMGGEADGGEKEEEEKTTKEEGGQQ